MLKKLIVFVLILALPALPAAWSAPLSVLQPDHPPLAAELSSRVAARASRLMSQDFSADPRVMLPSLQELAAIKRVAETLITLGQEVIPAIIGEMPMDLPGSNRPPTEVPNDAVSNK